MQANTETLRLKDISQRRNIYKRKKKEEEKRKKATKQERTACN